MGTQKSQIETVAELANYTADDIEEIRITSSQVAIHGNDGEVLRSYLMTQMPQDNVEIKLNGAKIASLPGGTWQPSFDVTRVEEFSIMHNVVDGEIEHCVFKITGHGEFSPS